MEKLLKNVQLIKIVQNFSDFKSLYIIFLLYLNLILEYKIGFCVEQE